MKSGFAATKECCSLSASSEFFSIGGAADSLRSDRGETNMVRRAASPSTLVTFFHFLNKLGRLFASVARRWRRNTRDASDAQQPLADAEPEPFAEKW